MKENGAFEQLQDESRGSRAECLQSLLQGRFMDQTGAVSQKVGIAKIKKCSFNLGKVDGNRKAQFTGTGVRQKQEGCGSNAFRMP